MNTRHYKNADLLADLPADLPAELSKLSIHHWQLFSEQHPDVVVALNPKQIELCQRGFALSDFVFAQFMAYPQWLPEIFATDFLQPIDFDTLVKAKIDACESEEELHKALRLIRRKYLAGIALTDLCCDIPLTTSLTNLSALADALIVNARDWLSEFCYKLWGQPQNEAGECQPLLIYAMGKLGGKELNFSSDIDLIFSYPDSGQTVGARRALDNQQFFVRLGQKLITALNQITQDGFVFRVDMRLRPFGDSGPLVMNFSSLENYYQDQGRDWERYAMLKARLVGDHPSHVQLQQMLRPFVFRRYIDFSVIESFRKMKMMIAQEARRRQLQHNIKLGVGGIREVEFIAQVFQLIRGGRIAQLQERNLLTALSLLVEFECISESSKQVLSDAYCFLRRSENAIQAFGDQQTQQLPDDEINQARLCFVMGFANWQDYLAQCQKHMRAVNEEFKQLVGEENETEQNADEHWVTYWLADWPEDEACHWILSHQSQWPAEQINNQLQHFKHDLKKRTIGQRGRLILDKLIPSLLGLLAADKTVELTLQRTLTVLGKILTRTAYLELLYENPGAFEQLLKLCRASEWIAELLAKFPMLLDELIDPKLLYAMPEQADYLPLCSEALMRIPEDDLEAQMEGLRQFKQAMQLKTAAADITGILPVMKVSDHLTYLAEAIINEVVNMAWQQMVQRYGAPKHSLTTGEKNFAVIGYGKLGGLELGYGSDLDLVFVHNSPAGDNTTGEKQISAMQFYLKLGQRIQHLFNTRTASGILYEADMRLRPSGNSGALVIHIDSFEQYQHKEAWTWEHQALVRARMVYSDPALLNAFTRIRQDILATTRNLGSLKEDVSKMRVKMRNHLDKSTTDQIDIKQSVGGLADIEFIAQYLVLANAHIFPTLAQYSDNVRIFEQLAEHELLSQQEAEQLTTAYCQLRDMGHALVLQSKPTLVDKQQLQAERAYVEKVWHRLFE